MQSRQWPGQRIGVKAARKLVREAGGTPDLELRAELERVLGYVDDTEISRLADGRIVEILYGRGGLYDSVEDYRRMIALLQEMASRKPQHPLGAGFPNGEGFIDAVPRLVRALPDKLRLGPEALTGTVDSLEFVDKAVRRLGGPNCFKDPAILAPIIAYVGEIMRDVTTGRWQIRQWDFSGGEASEQWEPVVVGADGVTHHPFGVFKELLERGSIYVRVNVYLGFPRQVPRPELQRPPTGALGEVPGDAYRVTEMYGDGRPKTVSFNRDVLVGDFPCRAGTEASFNREGDLFLGTLSQAHGFGALQLGAGARVGLVKGRKGVHVSDVVLAEDQTIDGVPCRAGKPVLFGSDRRISSLELAADCELDGIPCAGGSFVAFHKSGQLAEARLAEAHVVRGRNLPGGTWLYLDAKGRLVRVHLAQDWDIDGIPAKAGHTIQVHGNGRLALITLARSHSIAGETYPEGTTLQFSANGGLTHALPKVDFPR